MTFRQPPRWAVAIGILFLIAMTALTPAAAGQALAADDDDPSATLRPLTFANLPAELRRAFAKATVRDPLTTLTCLEGEASKPKVCTYKVADGFLGIMASSDKGGSDVTVITMICNAKSPAETAKCLLAYHAGMALAGGAADVDTKAKLFGVLLEGLDYGNATTIETDDRKFVLQKSIGLWLHIIAINSQQAQ